MLQCLEIKCCGVCNSLLSGLEKKKVNVCACVCMCTGRKRKQINLDERSRVFTVTFLQFFYMFEMFQNKLGKKIKACKPFGTYWVL